MVKLNKKTGIIGYDCKVFDKNGIFYSGSGERYFNLPPGEYEFDNCEIYGRPVNYNTPVLFFPERLGYLPSLKNIKMEIEKMPYSAAIDISSNEIFVNSDEITSDTPTILCLICHELGHYFYDTEYKCDIFAINYLLKYGLNPSQFDRYIYLLSNKSIKRQNIITDYCEYISEKIGKPSILKQIFR